MSRKEDPGIPDFEKAMKQLEAIVQQIEAGDLPLEKSLELYEKGVKLARECQKALSQAEQKVAVLTNMENGGAIGNIGKEAELEVFEAASRDDFDDSH